MSIPDPGPTHELSVHEQFHDRGLRIDCRDSYLDTAVVSNDIAKLLGAMWADGQGPRPGLIFPLTRPPQIPGTQDTRRVSEQESRVLLTEWLEDHGFHYSIETPTNDVYQQSGLRGLSARTDVTVYGSSDPDPRNRILNIELKAGRPPWESFRKDFEKLLREGVHGLWFHTLKTANERIWRDLENKIHTALDERQLDPVSGERDRKDLTEAIENADRSIHFAFCVLESGSIERSFTIDFGHDWHDQLVAGFRK